MDGLCAAFQRLAATCEGGTMMQDLGPTALPKQSTAMGKGRVAGSRGGLMAGPSGRSFQPYQNPRGPDPMDTKGLADSIASISNMGAVTTEMTESCGCLPPTRENIYSAMMMKAQGRGRWDDAPLEEVRQKVCNMARLGTEDNQTCVPWRVSPRNTLHLPVTNTEGEQYDADFVIVAPSPQRYYEGETIVFTPKVAVQPSACLLSVITMIECKFKACWELAHLVSLSDRDKRERMGYSTALLSTLALSRSMPEEIPAAIVRPFARPPNAIAPPVSVSDLAFGEGTNPAVMESQLKSAFDHVVGNDRPADDTTVDLASNAIVVQPPPQQMQQQQMQQMQQPVIGFPNLPDDDDDI